MVWYYVSFSLLLSFLLAFPRIPVFFIIPTTNVLKITSLHIANGTLLTARLLRCFDLINMVITKTTLQLQPQVNRVLLSLYYIFDISESRGMLTTVTNTISSQTKQNKKVRYISLDPFIEEHMISLETSCQGVCEFFFQPKSTDHYNY